MKKKKITIISITILVILIVVGAFFGIQKAQKDNQKKVEAAEQLLITLEEKEIKLKTSQHEIFLNEGFSEEYYKVSSELENIQSQISENNRIVSNYSSDKGIFFTILPVVAIAIFGISFITVFVMIIILIYRNVTGHHNIPAKVSVNKQTEDMVNMLGKVAVNMAKEINPEYKSLKCPNCGAALADNVEVCEYCNAPLTKVVGTKK